MFERCQIVKFTGVTYMILILNITENMFFHQMNGFLIFLIICADILIVYLINEL